MTLESFIVDFFGTKELAARRMKIARWTMYRWLKDPDSIQLKYYKRLAQITDSDVHTLIKYGQTVTGRVQKSATVRNSSAGAVKPSTAIR